MFRAEYANGQHVTDTETGKEITKETVDELQPYVDGANNVLEAFLPDMLKNILLPIGIHEVV